MTVAATSRESFDALRECGALSRQKVIVLATVAKQFPITRSQIEVHSGMRLSAVCGRVNDLVGAGLLEVAHKGRCPITGYPAEYLELTDLGRLAVAVKERQEAPA